MQKKSLIRRRTRKTFVFSRVHFFAANQTKAAQFLRAHYKPVTVSLVSFFALIFFLNIGNISASENKVISYATYCSQDGISESDAAINNDSQADFTLGDASFFISNTSDDIICKKFTDALPSGVIPTKAVIHLSFSIQDSNNKVNTVSRAQADLSVDPVSENSTDAKDTNVPNLENSESEILTPEPDQPNEETDILVEQPIVPEVVEEPAAEEPTEVIVSFLEKAFTLIPVYAQESESEPVTLDASLENVIPIETGDSEEPTIESSVEYSTELIENFEDIASSGVLNKASTDSDAQLFTIEYSFDQNTWIHAGTVTLENWQDTSFAISDASIDQLRAIDTIMVRLIPNDSYKADFLVFVDTVFIETYYEDIPKLLNPPTIVLKDSSLVVSGAEDFSSTQIPTFTITDPGLTIADVQTLVGQDKADVVEDSAEILDEKPEPIPDAVPPTGADMLNAVVAPITEAIENFQENVAEDTQIIVSWVMPKTAYAQTDTSLNITDAVVVDSDGNETDITVTITTNIIDGVEQQQIVINRSSREFRPGRYTLRVTLRTSQVIIISEQDFTWGVLSMNMEKSMYSVGENAYLQMGVLDDKGNTVCDAQLDLLITSPSGIVTNLSTNSNTIIKNPECGPNNIITTPDYWAHFTPTELGDYAMRLTATTANGTKSIIDRLRVVNNAAFIVKRSGPTRIYPAAPYPMTIRVTSPVDWQGTITETVPESFEITPPLHSIPYSNIETDGDVKKVSWNISLIAGQEATLGYYFDAPDVSPEFYLVGPLIFTDESHPASAPRFGEAREWQIASDATCAATTSGNWSTGGNWTGCSGAGGIPGTGDNITINNGVTIALNTNSAVLGTITINGALTASGTARTLSGTTLTIGSTGSFIISNATGITLSGTTGTPLTLTSGGTFTAGTTSTITLTGNNGSGNTTIPSNITYNNLTTNVTGETFVLNGTTTMTGTLTVTLGTVDTTGSNHALSVGKITLASSANAFFLANASAVTLTGTTSTLFTKGTNGTFTAGTSTFDIAGNGDAIATAGAATFYNLTFSGTGAKSIGSTAVVTNVLTINAGAITSGSVFTAGHIFIGTSGAFTAGAAITMTGTTGTLLSITGGGVFTGASSTITVTGNGSNIINSAGFTGSNALNSLTINISGVTKSLGGDLDLSGTLTVTAGTLDTTGSNYDLTATRIVTANAAAAIFLANASTINLTGTSGILFNKGAASTFTAGTSTVNMTGNGDATINSGTVIFCNLISSGTGTKTASTMTVSHVFTISAGTVSGAAVTITLSGTTGTPFVNSGTFDGGTGTVTFTGDNASGNTTIPSNVAYHNVTLNNASETYVLDGATNIGGLLTVTLGTFDTTGSNHALNAENITIANSASAIINANASTITLDGVGVTLFTRGASGVFNEGTSTIVVASPSGVVRFANGTLTVHQLVINNTATIVNAGAVITTGNAAGNGITVTAGVFNDGGSQIVAGTGSTLTVAAGATVCLGGHATSTSASCDSAGTAVGSATTIPAFSTISLDPASTVIYLANGNVSVSTTPTYGNLYFRPVLVSNTRTYTVTGPLTVAGDFDILPTAASNLRALLVTMTGTWDITGDFSIAASGAGPAFTTFSTGTNYALNIGGLVTLGDGTSATTFDANASTITVSGSWTNNGAFSAETSNVVLNTGTTAVISGDTSFYDLTITHSSAKEVNFATTGSPVFDVTHTFTVTGHAGGLIKLYSDASPTQWNFHPTGTAVVDYADVKDGACEPGAITIYTTNSTDSTNNDSCWDFGAVIQTLTFSLSTNSIGFGTLSASAARYCTADGLGSGSDTIAHTVAVATNAATGYTLAVRGATLTSGGHTITAIGGSNTASAPGTEQFGIRATASGGIGAVVAPYDASGFAYDATALVSDVIGSAASGDGATTTYSLRYLGNISPATEPGSYSSNITYVVTGNF